jgi:2-keto-4-pentenoate hydratase/2-oxohepta-3-ene-1,7-dioic acid hydratase in catechol pathway
MGPYIVTPDEIDASNVRLWCTVDSEKRQDSTTADLLYGIDHLVWYISQFMELFPGDIINTGTPSGVGMGHTPTKYLQDGQVIETGIDSIGRMKSKVIQFR